MNYSLKSLAAQLQKATSIHQKSLQKKFIKDTLIQFKISIQIKQQLREISTAEKEQRE